MNQKGFGLSLSEISKVMGISVPTASNLLRSGLEKMRIRLMFKGYNVKLVKDKKIPGGKVRVKI